MYSRGRSDTTSSQSRKMREAHVAAMERKLENLIRVLNDINDRMTSLEIGPPARQEGDQPRQSRYKEAEEYYDRDRNSSQKSKERPICARESRGHHHEDRGDLMPQIPSVYGNHDPNTYLEWERKVELVFNSHRYSEINEEFETAPIYDDYEEYASEEEVPDSSSTSSEENLEIPAKGDLIVAKRSPSVQTKAVEDVQQEALIPMRYQQHEVIYSMLIKEKPLDSPQHFPTNDFSVSRTKRFQEEGYDTIMESPEKNHESCTAQTKSMSNLTVPKTTRTTFLPHPEHSSMWIQSNPSSGKEAIPFSNQTDPGLCDLDLRMFKEFFQPNQMESSHKINFSGILIHQSNYENWNQPNWSSYVQEMDFSSPRICFNTQCASMPKIESHSPTQVRYSYATSWRMFINLLCFQRAQDHKKWTSDHRDSPHLPKWVELVLCLKNARPTWFGSYQTYVWHPGTSIPSPK